MGSTQLLAMQSMTSLVAWGLVAWVVIRPWAVARPIHRALAVVMLPLAFRHLGTNMLSDQLVRASLDSDFARHVAIGDALTVGVSVVAIVLLARVHRGAIAAAWIANVIGLADLLFNVVNGARLGVAAHVGAQWYVLAFGVPGMAMIHVVAFWMLLRHPRTQLANAR